MGLEIACVESGMEGADVIGKDLPALVCVVLELHLAWNIALACCSCTHLYCIAFDCICIALGLQCSG